MMHLANVVTIDQKIAEWFNNNFSSTPLPEGAWSYGNLILCVLAIALCAILCGLIGMEREKRRRSAGLRTHLLVGIGSCIIMIISIYGFPLSSSQRDVARLAAQVIAGIGFLGAGAIMHTRGSVKGLTTASTIWTTMAVGLSCGSMNFILAIGATTITLFILVSLRKAEEKIAKTTPYFVLLAPSEQPLVTTLLKVAEENNWNILNMSSRIVDDKDSKGLLEITFGISSKVKGTIIDQNEIMYAFDKALTIISIQPIERS